MTATPPGGWNRRSRFMLAAALITLFGLALRLLYVFTAQVEHPIYGDGLQYMVYAWNLWTHGVFSSSPAGSQIVVPDGYREPGYPIFLAAAFGLAGGDVDAAVRYAWLGQVLLGAICVPMTIGLARQWLDWNLSLLAGLLVACWPHMITFCGALMTETLFGFFILLGLLLLCTGERMVKRRFVAAAGLAFGGAYLVKGIVLMFPFLAALALARRGKVMLAAVLMTTTAIAPIAWTWRNAQLPSAQAQTELNQAVDAFVWGSSPVYLVAFDSRWVSAEAKQIVERERQEAAQMHEDPGAGLDMIAERMGQDPLAYVSWYLLEKPFLLWDWSIVIGNGDIYYPPTRSSPFERIAALKVIKIVLQWLNPLLFALALLSMARFLWRFFVGRDEASFTPIALAIFMFYMTVMHAILTAEPRYSIPYRPVEIVLAVGTLALLAGFVQRRRGEPRGITRDGLVGSQERLP